MPYTSTASFRTICRLVLFCFTFAIFHPAALGVPKTLDLKLRISQAGALTLNFGPWTLDFGPSSAYGQVQDPLLAPTPEFDLEDPFIVTKANELNYDPAQIFAFMRDEIGYEAYQGSLRGARGTLWSKAGNALDQASLMIAMLRASGVKARYVKGTLGTSEAQIVILSMFPPVLRIVGCPPANALKADPANDPKLLAEAKEHYWVEYGSGFTPADPTFPNAQIGQTFTSRQGDFTEVPDSLRHKVTVRLKAELKSSFPTTEPDVKNVLNQTFITATLVGKPLSVGHFVNSKPSGGLAFSTITHVYSPYILVGQNGSNIEDDEIIRGTDYQEVITNFPLGNQLLTGLFLKMEVKSPDGKVETYERALVDRIGFVARQNGETTTIDLSAEETNQPALTDLEIVTINVLPGLQDLTAIGKQKQRLTPSQERLNELSPLIATFPPEGPLTREQEALFSEALSKAREVAIITAETVATAFAGASDEALTQIERGYLTKGYYVSPRLILALTSREGKTLTAKLDLRKNNIKTVPFPGQVVGTDFNFEIARGLIESTLEGKILASVIGQPVISVSEIFRHVSNFVVIDEENFHELESLSVSAEAKARISQAVQSGKSIFTPTQIVTIGETTTIGWFETDPITGHTISVMEDGDHGALGPYGILLEQRLVGPGGEVTFFFIGAMHGFSVQTLAFLAKFLGDVNDGKPFTQIVKESKTDLADLLEPILPGPGVLDAFDAGFTIGTRIAREWINRNLPADPPVFRFLSSDLGPGPALVPPGSQPGVNAQIVLDGFFTESVGDAEVPSVYNIRIQNTGPSTDKFFIALPPAPPGYTLQSSVPEIIVPPGQTAEVGICLRPINGIGAPGTSVPFSVTVTGTGTSATDSETFVTPDVHGVTLTPDPAFASASPGSSVPVELTITAAGNVAENVTLSAALPTGVTLNGLPSNVTLVQGETKTFPLTLNVSNSVVLNTTLHTTITATFGSGSPPQMLP